MAFICVDITMESAIQKALKVASEKQITGKLVTPFILQYIADLTDGRSLQTSILQTVLLLVYCTIVSTKPLTSIIRTVNKSIKF